MPNLAKTAIREDDADTHPYTVTCGDGFVVDREKGES